MKFIAASVLLLVALSGIYQVEAKNKITTTTTERPHTQPRVIGPTEDPPYPRDEIKKPAPTNKPVPKPAPKPVPKPVPTNKPVPKPTIPTIKVTTRKPVNKPTSKPTSKPVNKPTSKPTRKPVNKPTSKPTRKPIQKVTTRKPVNKPTRKPVQKVTTRKPVNKPTSKPTRKPVQKVTTRKPVNKPTPKPTRKPIQKVTTRKPAPKPTQTPVIPAPAKLPPYKPFPAKEPWSISPHYFAAINEGRYDNLLDGEVIFANNTISDFGILGQRDDLLLRHNPTILRLNIIRERCPAGFVAYFLRKVNHIRQRHQAGPLLESVELSSSAQKRISKQALVRPHKPALLPIPANVSASSYRITLTTPGVTNIRLNAEQIVQQYYQNAVRKFRNYGKAAPKPNPTADGNFQDFANLIWASSSKVGVACTTVQQLVIGRHPQMSIKNELEVLVYYNNHPAADRALYATNVLPPGYFDFDVKHIRTQETEVNLNAKNYEI